MLFGPPVPLMVLPARCHKVCVNVWFSSTDSCRKAMTSAGTDRRLVESTQVFFLHLSTHAHMLKTCTHNLSSLFCAWDQCCYGSDSSVVNSHAQKSVHPKFLDILDNYEISQLWTGKWHKWWRTYQWLNLYKLVLCNQSLFKLTKCISGSIAYPNIWPNTVIFSSNTKCSDVFVLNEASQCECSLH